MVRRFSFLFISITFAWFAIAQMPLTEAYRILELSTTRHLQESTQPTTKNVLELQHQVAALRQDDAILRAQIIQLNKQLAQYRQWYADYQATTQPWLSSGYSQGDSPGVAGGGDSDKTVHVNGYFRSNGTYVNSYYRSAPSHH